MVTAKIQAGTQIFYWRFKMSEEIEIVEEQQPKISVADMLRTTSQNTNNLLMQMADHIDKLEEEIVQLTNRIQVLESQK